MANEIHVVRAMTVSGINTELYYRKKASAAKAFDTIKARMAALEKKKEGASAPLAWLVEMVDDFGIRVAIDLRGVPVLIQTNTTSAAETQAEINRANREALERTGQAVNAGFQPTPDLVVAGAGR